MVFRTWDLNFEAWEILGYGFQDMVFKTWDLNFGAWEILGYSFQDLGSQLWGLGNSRISSGHGFQDLGSQLWGLGNFRIWLSGHGFQDLGSQLWALDFHTRGFQDRNLKTFRTWFSRCGTSILGPGFTQCPKVRGTHGGLHSGLWPQAPTSKSKCSILLK